MNQDLHKLKASAMFNVSYNEVTDEQRRYAKTVNFFNIYCKEPIMRERYYHIVAINEKSGAITYMTSYPMTHSECCTMMSKISKHPARRIQLVEVSYI